MRATVLLLLAGALALTGCEIADVTTVDGEDVVIVEGVLEAGAMTQRLILHRSVRRGAAGPPPLAEVSIASGEGTLALRERAPEECVDLAEGAEPPPIACYVGDSTLAPFVVPGGEYELRVRYAGEREMSGRTMVPGSFALRLPGVDVSPGETGRCVLPAGRELILSWTRAEGAWSYLGQLEIFGLREALPELADDLPEVLRLTGLSISEEDTTMTLPRDFGLFQRGQISTPVLLALRDGLPPNASARLTLAALDRNYVNGIRGGAFNPSGTVRVPSVSGDGTGVFGSMVPLRLEILADDVGSRGTPSCVDP